MLFDCRGAFAEALIELLTADRGVVVVTNDSVGSSNLAGIRARFPERVINLGIAEQNMIGVGAGLANGGKIPFLCGASCFLTGRALEQIKVDLAYSRSNVKLCGMSAGLAYGPLGATHHSIEDLAWMRVLPGLVVIVPADPAETAQAVRAAAALEGPVYLRLSRMPVPPVHPPDYVFRVGKAARLREGSDLTLIACGTMVSRALAAAELLRAEGLSARVLNMATIQPLDCEAVECAARETGAIVTVEEHSVRGGLGGGVAEIVVSSRPVPMRLLGVPGTFAPTGSAQFLFEHFGLTADGIARAALDLLRTKVTDAGTLHPCR
ncbi:MAG: transketolase C-terminal domain-containing protein [Bryobacterales bacterium]|nr:transketolase C-terminal domain-containing protein [Bryobacterales bacterium]